LDTVVRDHKRAVLSFTADLEKKLEPLMQNFGYPLRGDLGRKPRRMAAGDVFWFGRNAAHGPFAPVSADLFG